MSNFIQSVITVILLALGLIVGPIMTYQTTQISLGQQAIVNDTNQFLNGLSDRGYVTGQELDEYYNQINSHAGIKVNADIQVSMRAPTTDAYGNATTITITKYNDFDLLDDTDKRLFNKGDIIEIDIQEVGLNYWGSMMYRMLRLDPGGFYYHMADTVQ